MGQKDLIMSKVLLFSFHCQVAAQSYCATGNAIMVIETAKKKRRTAGHK